MCASYSSSPVVVAIQVCRCIVCGHCIFDMKNGAMIDRMVEALMIKSTFSQSGEYFTEVDVHGLDKAYANHRLECIAVKGTVTDYSQYPRIAGSGS